jgi:hypothetical protein
MMPSTQGFAEPAACGETPIAINASPDFGVVCLRPITRGKR